MLHLSILINLSVGIIWNRWRIKEVEEAVSLDLLGDGSDVALGLVLLLLLDLFDGDVLVWLPVNLTPRALDDLWTLE